MKLGIIKYKNEKKFEHLKLFGANIVEIVNPEEVDNKIKELYSEKYSTILISNEVASFSQDIIKKYGKKENIKIIIAPANINE